MAEKSATQFEEWAVLELFGISGLLDWSRSTAWRCEFCARRCSR